MRTAGVDLAASPAATAVALVHDDAVVDVTVGAGDDEVVALTSAATKIGIDCPLGWPAAFTAFVAAVASGSQPPPAETVTARVPLAYRETDRWIVAHRPPLRPLSVSADRIAHVAFRCAGLLPRLDPAVDRSGAGRVVEVYPAGSLHAWSLPFRRYKGREGGPVRAAIVTGLETHMELGRHRAACLASDHALDAVVAACTAGLVARGRAQGPPPASVALAAREGWIWLPTA